MVSGTVFSVYSVLWGSLFCGVTLIHLIACAGKFDVVRRVTKVCVMPLLALWYSVLFPGGYTVLWALIFGTVGDILLLQPYKRTAFLAGLLAFFWGTFFGLSLSAVFCLTDYSPVPSLLLFWLFTELWQ